MSESVLGCEGCDQIDHELLLLGLWDGFKGRHVAEEGLNVGCCHWTAPWLSVHACQLRAQLLARNKALVVHVVADVLACVVAAAHSVPFLLKNLTCLAQFQARASYVRLRETLLYSLVLRLVALVVWNPEVFDVLPLHLKTILASRSRNPKVYDYMPVSVLVLLLDQSVDVSQRLVAVSHRNCHDFVVHQFEKFIIIGVSAKELRESLDQLRCGICQYVSEFAKASAVEVCHAPPCFA